MIGNRVVAVNSTIYEHSDIVLIYNVIENWKLASNTVVNIVSGGDILRISSLIG